MHVVGKLRLCYCIENGTLIYQVWSTMVVPLKWQ